MKLKVTHKRKVENQVYCNSFHNYYNALNIRWVSLVHLKSAITSFPWSAYMFVFFFVHFVFLYTFQGVVQLKTEEKVPVSTIDGGSHHEVANPFDNANLKHGKRKSFIVFYRIIGQYTPMSTLFIIIRVSFNQFLRCLATLQDTAMTLGQTFLFISRRNSFCSNFFLSKLLLPF